MIKKRNALHQRVTKRILPKGPANEHKKFLGTIRRVVPEEILKNLKGLVKEIYLVGSTVKGKKADVDIVIVATKKLDNFTEDEYYRLLVAEEKLTEQYGRNFELFVRLPEEFRKDTPYIPLWKK